MDQVIQCLRCRTEMEQGVIGDSTYGGHLQEAWAPGPPKVSFWTGLKIKREETIPVTTMRCPNCGALESYARPAT